MRGWCACAYAIVCAVVAASAGAGRGGGDEVRADLEKHLLALLGLPHRPAPRGLRPPVPRALRMLYDARGILPAPHTNTARSYHHVPSSIDGRFTSDARFRLFFNITNVPPDEIARGAQITFHRTARVVGLQRLMVYDIVRPGRRGKSGPILRLLDSVPMKAGDGTVTADAYSAASRWMVEPQHNHGLLVRILDEEKNGTAPQFPHVRVRRSAMCEDEWRTQQPVMLLFTEDARSREARSKRSKRAATRRGHRPRHRRKEERDICQRRPLFVDFADVGWSDWIVAPHGYDAYYCQGDCPFPLTDHLNGTNHAIVQTLVNSVNPAAVPKACCVPTQLSSISMLYMDEVNNVVLKNYQDMMVLGCGCR